MEIEYYTKNVYGRDHMYVKDRKVAEAIESLTHKKTIDRHDMDAFKSIGHKFKQVLP